MSSARLIKITIASSSLQELLYISNYKSNSFLAEEKSTDNLSDMDNTTQQIKTSTWPEDSHLLYPGYTTYLQKLTLMGTGGHLSSILLQLRN